jgi:DNA polymerase III subunit gamma/tau
VAYQVIARKYRPQRFSDVVGQEHITQTLANTIEQKRIAHAYLFCGPHGTGKTTIARIFAKCLNCSGGPKVNFDDKDPRCVEITECRSLDVLEIDGASNNGVEQVRELRETCKYAPANSPFKIYIIDEVHMLSTAAFNALLKTLEEPPAHVKFMFATTDPEKVLPTILSRCQRFDLRRIPAALIVKHLAHIAKQEKIKADEAALYAVARGAEGSLRDAESTLDQLISFCGEKIEESDVLSMFGLVAQSQILGLTKAILAGEIQATLGLLDELAQNGKDLGRLLSDLLNHFRNLLVFQVSRGNLSLLEVSETEVAALKEQSTLANTESLTRILEVLTDSEIRLRDAASKKILLEVTLLKAIEARNTVGLDSVLKQLNQWRNQGGTNVPHATAAGGAPGIATAARPMPKAHVAHQETIAHPLPAPTSIPPADLMELWSKLIEAVGRVSSFTRSYLVDAHLVSFEKNLLTIGFDPEFEDHLGLVDNARNHALLQTKLAELGHANCQVKFIKAEAAVGRKVKPAATASVASTQKTVASPTKPVPPILTGEKPAPVSFSREDFKNDPLIQKALEIFKGQIVEVRS